MQGQDFIIGKVLMSIEGLFSILCARVNNVPNGNHHHGSRVSSTVVKTHGQGM